jgi:tetratricopeptide (TPR) repeat protein
MEPMRITAKRTEDGDYELDSYDAQGLFEEGTKLLNEGHCQQAVRRYDQLADEFPSSKYASPALYNAGLCLQRDGELEAGAARYERLIEAMPDSPDIKDATFQLAKIYVELERWNGAIEAADALLAREDLSPDQRVEAMARRAQGLLGLDRIEEAEAQARSALSYARTRREGEKVHDTYFLAAANYVLAETFRHRAAAITIPQASLQTQRAKLEKRAELLLEAQREYFDTIRRTDPRWAAAAGYHIGEMYDSLWQAIMTAPVPPPDSELSKENRSVYEEEYRKELARLVKPLIRHSIRYWELTLMMIERTGVETEWKKRIRQDLNRARERLLQQPEGRGGLDAQGQAGGDLDDPAGSDAGTPRGAGPAGHPDAGAPAGPDAGAPGAPPGASPTTDAEAR